jgi:hypothetical protein
MVDEIEMVEYSFTRDFVLMCSLGLNVGFLIGLLFI